MWAYRRKEEKKGDHEYSTLVLGLPWGNTEERKEEAEEARRKKLSQIPRAKKRGRREEEGG